MLVNQSRFDAAIRRFFARFGTRAEAFFVRYLQGVRWKEFFSLTSGVFAAGVTFGEEMRLPRKVTFLFAYVAAMIFALSYLRVPKSDPQKSDESEESSATSNNTETTPDAPQS